VRPGINEDVFTEVETKFNWKWTWRSFSCKLP